MRFNTCDCNSTESHNATERREKKIQRKFYEIIVEFDKSHRNKRTQLCVHMLFFWFVFLLSKRMCKKIHYTYRKKREEFCPSFFFFFELNIKILWFDSIMQTVQVIKTLIGYIQCINKTRDKQNQKKESTRKRWYEWMSEGVNERPIKLIN